MLRIPRLSELRKCYPVHVIHTVNTHFLLSSLKEIAECM